MSTRGLSQGVNEALVCSIPKIKFSQTMRDLRPVSSCNVLVRIPFKVVTNILKLCFPTIISDKQSAFIESRMLIDNAMIAFEINHYLKRRTQGSKGMTRLKLDVLKAYDRLKWAFIWSMMERNEEVGLLHGCRTAKGAPVISHLLFADDCYLFFRATGPEANVMRRILGRCAEASGQIINFTKSAIVFSPNTKDVDCAELQAWSLQNISKAGKLTLLKTAAQSVPNFWMNLLLLPLDVCELIEKKMNAYWWGNGRNRREIKWMSWDHVCEAKKEGGMGFKKLRDFNIAMLAKQAWRLMNNDNPLVTKIMKARYCVDSEFIDATLELTPVICGGAY
ncbi:uncharacterized protein LOC141680315 [Apium graveolens]|uniref:uncharacterized protein LOC141680315 n=1 Tax=Apium graveolens TaxID=4045 RepID=UPI003D79919E